MRIFFISFCISLFSFLSFSIESVLATCPDATNITCPEFKIDLSRIDPVSKDAFVPTGTYAVTTLLEKVAGILLFIIPIIAGVSLIIAGYYYILSSGDSEKANQAKTIIKWNFVAMAVALFSYTLIYLVASTLDGTLL